MAKVGSAYHVDRLEGWIDYDIGRWADSRRVFQKACSEWQREVAGRAARVSCAVAMGMVDMAEGKSAAVRTTLEGLLSQPAAPGGAGSDPGVNLQLLQAAELGAAGKVDQAIKVLAPVWPGPVARWNLGQMVSYYCPLAQDDLARLYVQKQDWDRAITEYRVLTVIGPEHTNRRFIHPIYHYRLAQVYEKKGMNAEAVAEYERFVRLWEKADPPRPEVKDARSRVAQLQQKR